MSDFQEERSRILKLSQLVGQHHNLMLGNIGTPKYFDLGRHVVDVCIGKTLIPKYIYIYLGGAINVLTKDIMEKLNLQRMLRQIPIVLQRDPRRCSYVY